MHPDPAPILSHTRHHLPLHDIDGFDPPTSFNHLHVLLLPQQVFNLGSPIALAVVYPRGYKLSGLLVLALQDTSAKVIYDLFLHADFGLGLQILSNRSVTMLSQELLNQT
jgi:hypothetical protein